MVAGPGTRTASLNGGEWSPEMAGRVDVDTYYTAGLSYKNIEPLPQSGYQLSGGTNHIANLPGTVVRGTSLNGDFGFFDFLFLDGEVRIFQGEFLIQSIQTPEISTTMVPELDFYAEADTLGVFHRELKSIRLLRQESGQWTKDFWPYVDIPHVDLGGNYPKTTDEWELYLTWTNETRDLVVTLTIEGNTTAGIELSSPDNHPGFISQSIWSNFADDLRQAAVGLPGLNDDLELTTKRTSSGSQTMLLKFAGSLTGNPYQVDVNVVNTATAAARASNTERGETEGEPLFSETRGWPGSLSLLQDRGGYVDIPARGGAIAVSAVGEYFDLNVEGQADDDARLDAIRSQTAERILRSIYERFYMVFTNRAIYFNTNRTVSRNSPPNFVRVTGRGIMPGTTPVEVEGRLYFIDKESSGVFSLNYDQILENFTPDPEHLYASHLSGGFFRHVVQVSNSETDANRMWLPREDGRLVTAFAVRSQNILGFGEYVLADGGSIREVFINEDEELRFVVERDGQLCLEHQTRDALFQSTRKVEVDIVGRISELTVWDGKTVYAKADGYVLGPFTVENGAIELGSFYNDVEIGLWQPPVFESMPYVRVIRDNRIVRRAGRINSVHVNVIDTTSIAIGANGEQEENVSVGTTDNIVNQPLQPYTGQLDVTGLLGHRVDTTFTITQTRPGTLQVRDIAVEARL